MTYNLKCDPVAMYVALRKSRAQLFRICTLLLVARGLESTDDHRKLSETLGAEHLVFTAERWRLIKLGFLEKQKDGNRCRYTLTQKGKKLLREFITHMEDHEQSIPT
jgi:DNA-binding transcriptional regulator PaaX